MNVMLAKKSFLKKGGREVDGKGKKGLISYVHIPVPQSESNYFMYCKHVLIKSV